MSSLESLQQSINELSASIDKNIELLAKQREEINTLLAIRLNPFNFNIAFSSVIDKHQSNIIKGVK